MYHSISDDPEPGVSAYYQVNTSPTVFRQHMQFLAEHGYRTITVSELVEKLTTRLEDYRTKGLKDYGTTGPRDHQTTGHAAPPIRHPASSIQDRASCPQSINPVIHQSINPARLVCLTFDDGFRNFYTEAFPVLQEHSFTATMFLPTAFIGDTRRRFRPSTLNPQPSTSRDCLTWSEVAELHRAGIEFGSHTVSHPKLVELPWPEVESEISNSKSEIEARLGAPISSFCYPYAFPQADRQFAHRFTGLLAETGYRCCTTTELGRVHACSDPFRLKRLPANSLDDAALFAAKLDGAYDWLGTIQALSKKLKRSVTRAGFNEQRARPGTASPGVPASALSCDRDSCRVQTGLPHSKRLRAATGPRTVR